MGALLALGSLVLPAQAETSTISGTITAAASGEPVQGCANVYDLQYTWVGSGCADETGHWSADVESGVDYKVEVYANDSVYRSQWSGGTASFEEAAVVTAPATVDTALEYSRPVGEATIGGTITAEDTGDPLQACVTLADEAGDYVASTCASEDGTWSVDRLLAGAGYKVEFEIWDGVHVGEWADDAASYADADLITAPGTVDAALSVGGHLRGTLTGADGQPAEWSSVSIQTTGDNSTTAAVASTDETGHWSALVRPGDYVVGFEAWPATQWAFGQSSWETATHFTVEAGDTIQVDDQLLAAAKVQGTVTSDATGGPVEGACVTVYSPGDDPDNVAWAGEGCTDPEGHYSIDISAPGTYITEVVDPDGRYVSEYSGDTRVVGEAATFTVERGPTATVDASLATGASITGKAVDAKTGAPIADVCPQALIGHTGGWASGSVAACSGPDGLWTVKGLPAGSFAILVQQVVQDSAYSLTWAFKATSQATADLVAVDAGQAKKVRNVQLKPGGSISGRITDYRGQPVPGAYVSIDAGYTGRAGGPNVPPYAQTDEDGRYTIQGVPAGDHTVFTEPDHWGGLAPLWSGNADRVEDAAALRVKATRTTTYDAILQRGAQISGSVVTADGQPTTDNWMGIIRTTSGDYIGDFDVFNGSTFDSTFLPPGEFTLSLTRYTDNGEGETVWYDSATSEADATRVQLGGGEHSDLVIHLP